MSRVLSLLLLAVGCSPARPLTYREYARIKHPVPYVLQLSVGEHRLLYFGAAHTHDPADPEIADIRKRWHELGPDLAFNEGGNPPVLNDADTAVRELGEAGLVRHLAALDRIPVRSLEPAAEEEVALLRQRGVVAEEICVFYVTRQVSELPRRDVAAADDLAERISRDLHRHPALASCPRSVEALLPLVERLLPSETRWPEVPPRWFDPVPQSTERFTNRISRQLSELRDAHMVETLTHALVDHQRVFAVVGASHVVVQEPALRARLHP